MQFIVQEEELLTNLSLVSIYFYTSWMPLHKKMLTMLAKVEEKHKDISFFAIDADYFKSFCRRFNIDSVPTIIILSNGQEIKRINGILLTSALKAIFNDIYKNKELK